VHGSNRHRDDDDEVMTKAFQPTAEITSIYKIARDEVSSIERCKH
jgi:hypothetical protein